MAAVRTDQSGGGIGSVEVYYIEKKWEEGEEPFRQQEQDLIAVIGELLSTYVEKAAMEQARKEAEEKFEAISRSAQDAIIMMDSESQITFRSSAAENTLGYSKKGILGKGCHLLVPERYHKTIEKGRKKFKHTGSGAAIGKTLELAALRKDGTPFPIEISLSSVRIKHQWHTVAIVRDLSEQHQGRQQLMQSEKLAGIGTLAAGVAHEINNRWVISVPTSIQ
ncbi:MAG: PAS domain S-box protein [candidate division Zixibacteria bacterium]|nr:PAS domain S-box protein [candidate division Zixibacteria bacterium]